MGVQGCLGMTNPGRDPCFVSRIQGCRTFEFLRISSFETTRRFETKNLESSDHIDASRFKGSNPRLEYRYKYRNSVRTRFEIRFDNTARIKQILDSNGARINGPGSPDNTDRVQKIILLII